MLVRSTLLLLWDECHLCSPRIYATVSFHAYTYQLFVLKKALSIGIMNNFHCCTGKCQNPEITEKLLQEQAFELGEKFLLLP